MKNIKVIFFFLTLAVAIGVASLWALSHLHPAVWTHVEGRQVYHVMNQSGRVSLVSFSTEAEDSAYWEQGISYWQIEATVLPLTAAAFWWMIRNRQKGPATGFPVKTNDQS